MFSAVLFDLDGTLVDTGELIFKTAHATMLEVLGIDAPYEELTAAVGVPLLEQFERIARAVVYGSEHDRPTQALFDRSKLGQLDPMVAQSTETESEEALDGPAGEVRALRNRLITRYTEISIELHDRYIRSFEGIREMLEELSVRRIPLAVVTSKRRFAASADLEHFDFADYFDVLVCADDYPYHKPDPRPVIHGIELLSKAWTDAGIRPESCAFVGDSPFDMEAGRAAGCYSVAVSWGLFSRKALEEQSPDRIVDVPAELLRLLTDTALP